MYQSYVGLEIHIQLSTESKVFCTCRAAFGEEPNSNICPVCMGYPGVLPALNEEAVRQAYLVCRALDCRVNQQGIFERKNYFYPDMPKNYQISQFAAPFGVEGHLDLEYRKRKRRVRIKEVHLEEDAGKMIHVGELSLLDYNRAGTPLLEIVTMPDLEVGEEAELFLQAFRRLVRYLGVCDGNMEEGSLRCDANVSVNLEGQGLGAKVEIKNLNSFKFVRKALNFEIERQQEILERGGSVAQETRLWNENRDVTEGMRTKESAFDYRYFPEPDLPAFHPDDKFLESVETALVELPQARKARLLEQYGIAESQADFICGEKSTADYYERTVNLGADPQAAALWLAADVQKILKRSGRSLTDCALSPERFAELLRLLAARRIHGKIAKQVLEVIFEEDRDPVRIIKDRGWEQMTDPEELTPIIDDILDENSKAVEQIRRGDSRPMAFLVGQIMKKTSGRAEPGLVKELLNARFELAFVQVLSMGGAIGGRRSGAGEVSAGDLKEVIDKLAQDKRLPNNIRFEEIEISRILSEEITPEDWAALIVALDAYLKQENTSGLVIAHGTDTLSYTASLLFWLFPQPSIPVVLTATLDPLGADEALSTAILAATKQPPGIYLSLEGNTLSPLNMKFEKIARDGFRNWNLDEPLFSSASLPLPTLNEFDKTLLRQGLEQAISQVCIVRVYPGMKGDYLIALMNSGVRYFILELYDTGTANLRESPFSLRKAFMEGKIRGVHFFCTSQQEGIVDFSGYVTSHELWREGAIPMGFLTTESAYTRLLAALLCCESEEEVIHRMEECR
ncbi:MAG: Asp-tRNA(Asn)/Glu-tRNA(Gln) amidotransferase subunit GatB [Spirochaetaceae bacterium]|nr:MAG: Asp-tRNA(Asn)/Glu-tRNA(Gln) amidotransferase subunit GatB [Spirochaetaceae bacterium]